MSSNRFTLEQITEMARKVTHWKNNVNNGAELTSYVGEVKPKWYSLDKLVLKVGKFAVQDEAGQRYTYSVTVSYNDEDIANYHGENVSEPFNIAYGKKQCKNSKAEKALLEMRAALGNTPAESSVVQPLSYDDVLKMVRGMSDCEEHKRNFHVDIGSAARYRGSFDTADSPVVISGYKRVAILGGNLEKVSVMFAGKKVFEIVGGRAQSLLTEMAMRYDTLFELKKEQEKEARIERLKKGILGEKK